MLLISGTNAIDVVAGFAVNAIATAPCCGGAWAFRVSVVWVFGSPCKVALMWRMCLKLPK